MEVSIRMGKSGRVLTIGGGSLRNVVSASKLTIACLVALLALPIAAVVLPLVWFGNVLRWVDELRKGFQSDLAATAASSKQRRRRVPLIGITGAATRRL